MKDVNQVGLWAISSGYFLTAQAQKLDHLSTAKNLWALGKYGVPMGGAKSRLKSGKDVK